MNELRSAAEKNNGEKVIDGRFDRHDGHAKRDKVTVYIPRALRLEAVRQGFTISSDSFVKMLRRHLSGQEVDCGTCPHRTLSSAIYAAVMAVGATG